jgi:hypothetical protein
MLMAFTFSGFKEAGSAGDTTIFEHDLKEIHPVPDWIAFTMLTKKLSASRRCSQLFERITHRSAGSTVVI